MSEPALLGVDGGGSKTRALVADGDGKVIGVGIAGSANPRSVGWPAAIEAICSAIAEASAAAAGQAVEPLGTDASSVDSARTRSPFDAGCFGLAGMDLAPDRARMTEALAACGLATRLIVVHDADLVLPAAGRSSGIALICGTGSICVGVGRDGRQARTGGWGWLLGDEGSGYDLAVRALRLAARAADGRGQARALLDAALEHWGAHAADELLDRAYAPTAGRREVARMAERVLALAERGDPHSLSVVSVAADDAAKMVSAVADQVGEVELPLVLAGGLLCQNAFYRGAVCARLPGAMLPATLALDPALGAIALARRLRGHPSNGSGSFQPSGASSPSSRSANRR